MLVLFSNFVIFVDLALRCLMKCNEKTKNINGIVMAFCCHHRCFWQAYTGKQFFIENHLTDKDFDIMCGIVSWATCGSGLSREKQPADDGNCDSIKQSERLVAYYFMNKPIINDGHIFLEIFKLVYPEMKKN